jgi:hypothetical protein
MPTSLFHAHLGHLGALTDTAVRRLQSNGLANAEVTNEPWV